MKVEVLANFKTYYMIVLGIQNLCPLFLNILLNLVKVICNITTRLIKNGLAEVISNGNI